MSDRPAVTRPDRSSIVRRLVLVAIVAGLVTGTVGVVLVQRAERQERIREAERQTLTAAERTATLIDGRVDAIRAQLELLASRPAIARLDQAAGVELAVALRVSDELDSLELYDRNGRPVAAASSTSVVDVSSVSRFEHVGEVLRTGAQVVIVRDGGAPSLELRVPVEDPPGSPAGALVGRAPMAVVTEEAEARLLSEIATAIVLTPDGTIVGHRELDRVLAGERFPLQEVFGGSRIAERAQPGGGTTLVAAAPTAHVAAWVVVERDREAALALGETASSGVTLVLLAVIAAIVGAVIVATRRSLRPLGTVAEAVERLGAGDRGVRLADGVGTGEVKVVAAGFNRMADRLQQRQEELEEAELAARRSEERLRLMIEGVREYAIFLLAPSGDILSWNTGAHRVFGATADEARGTRLDRFLDPDDPAPDPVDPALRTGRGESEGWMRRTDGTRFWARTVVDALRDDEGAPYGYVVVVQDMTERHAAREAMEQALEREQQATEDLRRTNALKDEFLAMAAHELQTPLAAILGASSLLEATDDLDEEDAQHVRRIIEQQALDMRAMVQRLLDFGRLQAGRVRVTVERFDLRQELESHVSWLGHHLNSHEVVVDAPSVEVSTDRQALKHIVGNLLSNAAKFSEQGSRIAVRGTIGDGSFTVEVSDQGIGIPPEDQQVVFELFRQSRNRLSSSRGTGVGLAIVQRYVELLGGSVSLVSEVDQGTTFTVTLPCRATAAEAH